MFYYLIFDDTKDYDVDEDSLHIFLCVPAESPELFISSVYMSELFFSSFINNDDDEVEKDYSNRVTVKSGLHHLANLLNDLCAV